MINLNPDRSGSPFSRIKNRRGFFCFTILSVASVIFAACSSQTQNSTARPPVIVMNIPGYPQVFELNMGEEILIERSYRNRSISRTLQLKDIRLFREFNGWIADSLGRSDVYRVEVDVVISGKTFTLKMQPYQLPVSVEGLRLYVEAVKKVDEIPNLAPVDKMRKDVRFSVCLEGEPWGIPSELEFPVNDYRWRSASYNNTWRALVPFNHLYYHSGEDFGAIPDRLDVVAWSDGEVILSPLSGEKSGSNGIRIKNSKGIVFGYYHCNTESIDKKIVTGKIISKGQQIAKTGMTWNYKKSQHSDPHLHTGMYYEEDDISLFPYLIEAYFRKYDDKVLAVAGGYRFARAGDTIDLDASLSTCRDGEKIISYQWNLHDGRTINQPDVNIVYDSPGYYSEELIVNTDGGATDRDFLQVRVYDQEPGRKVAYGWAYYTPVRNLKPDQDILFWNRLENTETDVLINFGDGTAVRAMGDEILHSYSRRGSYTVELTSKGINDEPVSVKLEVVVGL